MTKPTLLRLCAALAALSVTLLCVTASLASRPQMVLHCAKGSPYPGLEMVCHLGVER
jgi:hypothetical protein